MLSLSSVKTVAAAALFVLPIRGPETEVLAVDDISCTDPAVVAFDSRFSAKVLERH